MVKASEDIGLLMLPVIAKGAIMPVLTALQSVNSAAVNQLNDGTMCHEHG